MNPDFLCNKCKKQLEKQSEFKIETNKNSNNYYQEHLYIFKYQGTIRNIILNYKFSDKSYLYKTIVKFIFQNKQFINNLKSYEIIIPVPISKKRYKERGYNQSELIAKELTKKLATAEIQTNKKETIKKIQFNNTSLIKTKNIIEQSKLNKDERIENIQGVYKLCNREILYNKKILLVDDIYTTGSTANECCKKLSEAKPEKIGVLTIAKD